jgi:hypothetical protein
MRTHGPAFHIFFRMRNSLVLLPPQQTCNASNLCAHICVWSPLINEDECNQHGTICAISSDFGDRMTTQSMGLMVLLSEYF